MIVVCGMLEFIGVTLPWLLCSLRCHEFFCAWACGMSALCCISACSIVHALLLVSFIVHTSGNACLVLGHGRCRGGGRELIFHIVVRILILLLLLYLSHSPRFQTFTLSPLVRPSPKSFMTAHMPSTDGCRFYIVSIVRQVQWLGAILSLEALARRLSRLWDTPSPCFLCALIGAKLSRREGSECFWARRFSGGTCVPTCSCPLPPH
jgi:hypothetical protein